MKRTLALIGIAALLPLAACKKEAGTTGGNATGNQAGASAGNGAAGDDTASGTDTPPPASGGGGPVNIRPGQYETTNEIIDFKVEGMPAGVPPGAMENQVGRKTSAKTCITPEDVENPTARMLSAQRDNRCTDVSADMSGGRIAMAMTCPAGDGGGTATMNMNGQYGATSYEMTGTTVMNGPNGMRVTVKSRTAGHRIGDCPA